MKTFYLLSAIPGSGKSTWAAEFKLTHPNTYIVSSDEVRTEVSGSAQCFANEKDVWKTFLNKVNEYGQLDEVNVIADATNLTNAYRRFYLENTPGFDRHVLVLFSVSHDLCEARNKMRCPERIVPDYAMRNLEAEYEAVDQETMDLYDQTILIDADLKETIIQ